MDYTTDIQIADKADSTPVRSQHARAPFFSMDIENTDPEINNTISREIARQTSCIELIAPKNYLSAATRKAVGSMMAFTSVEGYPGRRYHAGVENIDCIELLAIERAKQLFGANHANVQPHSGTQANQAVYFALLKPGDKVLSMSLAAGGHLSHGLKSNYSGKWFDTKFYSTNNEGYIDYNQMHDLAIQHQPKLIIVGGSSYPRVIDFEKVSEIAKSVNAKTLADVSHFSGLIVGGEYPNPFPHIDVITTTTNKNMRGPRGGLILTRDTKLGKLIDAAIFPGIQGGPLPEMITGKAVSFGESLKNEFTLYAGSVLRNARTLAFELESHGYQIVTGGTDTPLVMLDLRKQALTGAESQTALEAIGLTCNRNLIPFDLEGPNITSGLRFGTSAVTTRGMGEAEMSILADVIAKVLSALRLGKNAQSAEISEIIKKLSHSFPIYAA